VTLVSNSLALARAQPASNSEESCKVVGRLVETKTSSMASICELVWGARSRDRDIGKSSSCSRLGKDRSLFKLDLERQEGSKSSKRLTLDLGDPKLESG